MDKKTCIKSLTFLTGLEVTKGIMTDGAMECNTEEK